MQKKDMIANDARIGTMMALISYAMWGLFPLYWKALEKVHPVLVLCNRIIWASIFTVVLLLGIRRLKSLFQVLANPKRRNLAFLAGVLVTINWGVYIWAVHNHHVTEASLGYYINPLVSVGLGALFFKDKLDFWAKVAVLIAGLGIVIASFLLFTFPWVALVLAFSFGFYSLVKKKAGLGPLEGLAAETLLITPLALGFLAYSFWFGDIQGIQNTSARSFLGSHIQLEVLLLILAGPVTALPLLFFAAAANRLSLTKLGFIQYVSPSLQLVMGVIIFSEKIKVPMLFAFVTVIVAISIYVISRITLVKKDIQV